MRQHRAPLHPLTLLTALTICLLCVSGCNSGERQTIIQLARSAAQKVFGSLGRETGEIKVASSVMADQAALYGVSAESVTAVAGTADTQHGWTWPQLSIDQMADFAKEAKNNKVVSAGVGIACDGMAGKLQDQEQKVASLNSALVGMAYNDQVSFHAANKDLVEKLAYIKKEGSPPDKAAAVWLCYAYQVIPVK
jgi:hypothetical protein